jgi:RHS repeat-associated protein
VPKNTAGVRRLNCVRRMIRALAPAAVAVLAAAGMASPAWARPAGPTAGTSQPAAVGQAGQQTSPPAQVLQSSQAVVFGSQMQVFGRADGGSVDSDIYTPSAASWSGWQGVGGDMTTSPAAVEYGTQMQVFAQDSSGNTEQDVWSGSWSGWRNLGGTLSDAPVAVEYDTSQGGDQMQVYGLASNGQASYDVWSPSTGTWSGWKSLGGSNLTGEPSVVVYGQQLQVFARNASGTVYSDVYTPSAGTWSGWQSLGGTISSSPMAAQYQTSQSGDQMEVYGLASNGQAYGDAYTPGTGKWSGWIALGGTSLAGGVFPVQYGTQMELFARNSSGTVYSDVYTASAGTWSGWQSLGGTLTGNPVAVDYTTSVSGDQLEVYGQAGNGQTFADAWSPDTAKWSGWNSLGAGTPTGTGPVSNATLLQFPISDRASLQVNVGSGDALVTTSDLTLPEIGGPLTLGVAYNSLLTGPGVTQGSDGNGWRQSEGADVRLSRNGDGSVALLGEDGAAGIFTAPPSGSSTYGSPAVFRATLSSSPGSACSGSAYQLTWHATGEAMCFNSSGTLTRQTDRNGNTTAFSYNTSGQETQITYTPAGVGSPTETVAASYTGSYLTGLSQSGGAAGTKTVSYGVNGNGDLTSVKQADGTTITLGYDGSHDLTSIKNGAGASTILGYNSNGQVTSVAQIYGSASATAATRLSYASATQTQVADPTTNQSEPVSSVPNTTYTINSQDLVTKAVDPAGDTRSTSYTPFDDVETATNGLSGGTTANTYTSNNGESLNSSASPTGATTKLAYTNSDTGTDPTAQYLPSSSTDSQGNATAYTYNGAGNPQTAKNALAANAQVSSNSDGTPATSTDPDGGVTSYGHNSLHQLTTVTPPTSGSLKPVAITYDGFGRVATVKDGDGNTVTYAYDLADRITRQAYTGGSRTLTVTYAYDGAGNLKTQTDASGTTSWTYDGRDQVLTKNAASGGGTLTYNYDADGNMASANDAGGTTTYTYNDLNQLASLTDLNGDLWEFAYNAAGERTTTWLDTNSTESTWEGKLVDSFDASGRITRIQAYEDDSPSDVVSDMSYDYTASSSAKTTCGGTPPTGDTSLVQYTVNNLKSVTSVYCYDDGNRLTKVTNDNGTTYSYGYDGDGDVTSGTAAGALSYNTSNQITSSGYAYDGAGNLISDPSTGTSSLTYNDAEQLVGDSASDGSGSESITYAGASQDQPLSDGSATAITYGLAGQDGQPWVDSYAVGGGTDYIIRDQQGDPLGMARSGSSYMFVTDNAGSVTALVDDCGCTDATYAYTPYGTVATESGSLDSDNLIGYTGSLTDTTTTGYVQDGDRDYNPSTGAFTTQDTSSYLASPANGNRYAYAGDSPANYIDPTGHDDCGVHPSLCGLTWDTATYSNAQCDTEFDLGVIISTAGVITAGGVALPALTTEAGAVNGGAISLYGGTGLSIYSLLAC